MLAPAVSPISMESHCEKFRAPWAVGCTCAQPGTRQVSRLTLRGCAAAGGPGVGLPHRHTSCSAAGTRQRPQPHCMLRLHLAIRHAQHTADTGGSPRMKTCSLGLARRASPLPGCRCRVLRGFKGVLQGFAGVCGAAAHLHEAAVAVARAPRGDALADDARAGVGADVDHLGAGVGLLVVVGQRDAVDTRPRCPMANSSTIRGALRGDEPLPVCRLRGQAATQLCRMASQGGCQGSEPTLCWWLSELRGRLPL